MIAFAILSSQVFIISLIVSPNFFVFIKVGCCIGLYPPLLFCTKSKENELSSFMLKIFSFLPPDIALYVNFSNLTHPVTIFTRTRSLHSPIPFPYSLWTSTNRVLLMQPISRMFQPGCSTLSLRYCMINLEHVSSSLCPVVSFFLVSNLPPLLYNTISFLMVAIFRSFLVLQAVKLGRAEWISVPTLGEFLDWRAGAAAPSIVGPKGGVPLTKAALVGKNMMRELKYYMVN